MTVTTRQLECVDCGQRWMLDSGTVDVRCHDCRPLHQVREEVREHLTQLISTERGARVAQVALAAAHTAMAMPPGRAGIGLIRDAIDALAHDRGNERHTQSLTVRLAGAALLWASEITGALE